MPKTAPQDSTQSQIDRFKQLARELECDDDEAVFDEKLKKLAQSKPQPKLKPDDDPRT